MTFLSKGSAAYLQGQADSKLGNIRNVAMNEGVSIVAITEVYYLPDQVGVNTVNPVNTKRLCRILITKGN